MPVYALGDLVPDIDPAAWVAPDAVVIGNVTIGPESTIWPCAVLRGDYGTITIGARTSIQDGTVVHCGHGINTVVGDECVIGHNVYLEGCTIDDCVLVGSQSSVLPLSSLGRGCVIAAGAVVKREMAVPPLALAKGVPATVTENAIQEGRWTAGVQGYADNGRRFREQLRRID